MNQNQNRWLQLAHVAVCAALADVACTDEALMEALFVGLPSVQVNEVTAAAVAEALRRAGTIKDAAAALDRSRGFIYDSLRRRSSRAAKDQSGPRSAAKASAETPLRSRRRTAHLLSPRRTWHRASGGLVTAREQRFRP